MAEEEKTHVQDQGGFEGRRRYVPQGGFEGRYKAVPPFVKEDKPEERPPGKPEGEPGHLDLIRRILEQHNVFLQILAKLEELLKGVTPRQEERYYNTPQTAISVATPNPTAGQSLDPDNPGYQAERVFVQLNRIAPQISVINDGNAAIYVIITPDGTNWSQEAAILVGEARRFYNVYELRLRSTAAGTVATLQGGIYRVTEYEYSLAYTSTVLFNRTSFTVQSLQGILLPAAGGTQLPNITVPNGFALVIRATPGNAGNVYYAINSANTNVATTRGTLAAGDSVSLYISNANLVWVAGSIAAQNVDITVEQ